MAKRIIDTLFGKSIAVAAIAVAGAAVVYSALTGGRHTLPFPPPTVSGQVVREAVLRGDYSFTVQTKDGQSVEVKLKDNSLEGKFGIGDGVVVKGLENMTCKNYGCSEAVTELKQPYQIEVSGRRVNKKW